MLKINYTINYNQAFVNAYAGACGQDTSTYKWSRKKFRVCRVMTMFQKKMT